MLAALDLFAERGYEDTTVIEIAERAGLTKSTFFRHFKDKREVLFGGHAMADLIEEAIAAVPAADGPLDVLAHAMDAIGERAFTPGRRELVARRRAVIDANPELQEREALKGLALTRSMAQALVRRGVDDLAAAVAAQLGALVLKLAYERWTAATGDDGFGDIARTALSEVRAASARC